MKFNLKYVITFLVSVTCSLYGWAQTSWLANGKWAKFRVTETGIYAITFDQLNALGVNPANIDKLHLLGTGAGMMPETHFAGRKSGLQELRIWIDKGVDGNWNSGDVVVFYAEGPHIWNYNASSGLYQHALNQYDDFTYYIIGFNDQDGLRIGQLGDGNSLSAEASLDASDYLFFYEKELFNGCQTGRSWVGEKLGNETLTRNFKFSLNKLNVQDSVWFVNQVAAGFYDRSGTISVNLNNIYQDVYDFQPINAETECYKYGNVRTKLLLNSSNLDLTYTVNRPNSSSAGYVDYFEIQGLQNNVYQGAGYTLRNKKFLSYQTTEVVLKGSLAKVWDVTDPFNAAEQLVYNSGADWKFKVNNQKKNRIYQVFNASDYKQVEWLGALENQQIMTNEQPDFLIITHPDFLYASNDLANFRREKGLNVQVVNLFQIYQEFSAGAQDIVAIRDFIRERYISSNKKLKYVLLMGSTSYDLKNRLENNSNFIPIYHAKSTNKAFAFCLDDFYGYLDTNFGDPYTVGNKMLVAVGRIPARTKEEAAAVVNKIKFYNSPASFGEWRNRIQFYCDDVDDPDLWEIEFIDESEFYSGRMDTIRPQGVFSKIYFDAFKQISTGNGEKYPDVSAAINRSFSEGALIVNYMGHGGEKGWAQEEVLTVPMINSWTNMKALPLMFTATCEFSRFDDPSRQSGGELTLLNPNGGSIALMSTTRLVYTYGNKAINRAFWSGFGFPSNNTGPIPTIGEMFQNVKNRPVTSVTSEDKKFALVGDPSMPLALPYEHILVDSVNGIAAADFKDTIKAFSVVKVKGHIEYRNGGLDPNFTGTLWVTVFDKPSVRRTLANDNPGSEFPFKEQNSIIYKGQVSVKNGWYEFMFPVPKDIAYQVGWSKMSFYAHNQIVDASGYYRFKIGGSEQIANSDYNGPTIQLFMNDTTFKSGDVVQSESLFLARVSDESGFNSTGAGIGRDITGILDKGTKQEKSYILNEYFSYNLNSYQKGEIRFPMEGISEGIHTMTLRIWDIHNNSSTATITFKVMKGRPIEIISSLAAPNPSNGPTQFIVSHNKAGEPLEATLQIVDLSGRIIFKQEQILDPALSRDFRIQWDGNSNVGYPVTSGFYIYTIWLKDEAGNVSKSSGRWIKR